MSYLPRPFLSRFLIIYVHLIPFHPVSYFWISAVQDFSSWRRPKISCLLLLGLPRHLLARLHHRLIMPLLERPRQSERNRKKSSSRNEIPPDLINVPRQTYEIRPNRSLLLTPNHRTSLVCPGMVQKRISPRRQERS